MPETRSTRQSKKDPSGEKSEALKELSQLREGNLKRSEQYELKDEERIYDEVYESGEDEWDYEYPSDDGKPTKKRIRKSGNKKKKKIPKHVPSLFFGKTKEPPSKRRKLDSETMEEGESNEAKKPSFTSLAAQLDDYELDDENNSESRTTDDTSPGEQYQEPARVDSSQNNMLDNTIDDHQEEDIQPGDDSIDDGVSKAEVTLESLSSSNQEQNSNILEQQQIQHKQEQHQNNEKNQNQPENRSGIIQNKKPTPSMKQSDGVPRPIRNRGATSITPQESKEKYQFKEPRKSTIKPILPPLSANIKECLNDDDSLLFYWMDAQEDKWNAPGTVRLFGKVFFKSKDLFVSCCIVVRNIERNIYILPKKSNLSQDEKMELYQEVSGKASAKRISEFKTKFVSRKYAFEEEGIPHGEHEVMKLVYNAKDPEINTDISGSKNIKHIFGASQSSLELFLLKRKVKGPCWLHLNNVKTASRGGSWCRVEASVDSPKDVSVYSPKKNETPPSQPPLTIVSLNTVTFLNEQKNVNEIVALSMRYHTGITMEEDPKTLDEVHGMTFVRKMKGVIVPDIIQKRIHEANNIVAISKHLHNSEQSLLNQFLTQIHRIDPDVIVGHNFMGYDLDVLLHRMRDLGIKFWSKLGRLNKSKMPKLQVGAGGLGESTSQEKAALAGRLVCDTYLSAKDYLRENSYSLEALAQSQLGRSKIPTKSPEHSFGNPDDFFRMLNSCENNCDLASRLMFKLGSLPLTKQLSNIAGNLWSRTLLGARSERIEYLLLHEFYRRKFILPDKTFIKKKTNESRSSRKKPSYEGGLVLSPQQGLYDTYVLLLDFNSLYPSIIREYNICFTTIDRPPKKEDGTFEQAEPPSLEHPQYKQSILPSLLADLIDRRKTVKTAIKRENNSTQQWRLDITQKALKLTANSMYGCLGFKYSRFYAPPLAELITRKGRETLNQTRDSIESLGRNVIYGDTDSVMVLTDKTDYSSAKMIGAELIQEINTRHKYLFLDIDGLIRRMLLLSKKRYAALIAEEDSSAPDGLRMKHEFKGIDIVRREWCELSKEVSKYIIDQVFSDNDREQVVDSIHEKLRLVAEEVNSGQIPLAKFIISKELSKPPEQYADSKVHPHVQVALKLKAENKPVRVGQRIPYVICSGTTSVAERAYHPDMFKANKELKIDTQWYLESQIHPPVERLCHHIEGTDGALLAECMGLDPSKFNSHTDQDDDDLSYQPSNVKQGANFEDKYRDVMDLKVKCPNLECNEYTPLQLWQSIYLQLKQSNPSLRFRYLQCMKCGKSLDKSIVKNTVQKLINKIHQMYYCQEYVPQETYQQQTMQVQQGTRQLSMLPGRGLLGRAVLPVRETYSSKQLLTQLQYLHSLFDLETSKVAAKQKLESEGITVDEKNYEPIQTEENLNEIKALVSRYLNSCARNTVNLNQLFRKLYL